MSQNPESVSNQGEFAGHVKPSEPLMSSGVSTTSPDSSKKKRKAITDRFGFGASRDQKCLVIHDQFLTID
jgi:hypothetical protein